jgi:type II secretory pathway pseudopilin PulG
MHSLRRRLREEGGETLLELVMALGILGIAIVAIASTMAISTAVSANHRNEASAQTYARDYAEQIEAYVASGTSGSPHYVACAGANAYSPGTVGYTVPTGFTATVTAASAWNGSNWGACSTDPGFQKVSVTVASADTGVAAATESVDVVLRNPCRDTDGTCS